MISIPRIQADNVTRRKRADITREQILQVMAENPTLRRQHIAALLGCSEQTVDKLVQELRKAQAIKKAYSAE